MAYFIDDENGTGDDTVVLIRGKRIDPFTLSPLIKSYLWGSLTQWRLLSSSDLYPGIQYQTNIVCFDLLKKKKYKFVRYPLSLNGLVLFEEQSGTTSTGGSGGSGDSGGSGESDGTKDSNLITEATGMGGSLPRDTYLNTDATILIDSPKAGIEINLSNKSYISTNYVDHTVVEGETAQSIVENLTGKSDLSVIDEVNYRPYKQGEPIYPGYVLKIKNGKALTIGGGVSNSTSVQLTVSGAVNANKTITVDEAGDNESVGWETSIPITGTGAVIIEAQADSAVATSANELTPLHWLKINYLDENDRPVPPMSFCVICKDGRKITGQLNNGKASVEDLTPGSVDIEFIPDYESKLSKLQKQLKKELDSAVAYAEQEAEMLEQQWQKQAWWQKPVILGGAAIHGALQWVQDTVTGVYTIVDTVNKTGSKAIVFATKLAAHKAMLYEAYLSDDAEKIAKETAAIEAMQAELGENIDTVKSSLESMAVLASDSKTYKMLYDFPERYFTALSFTEKTHFTFRYGIDIALVFAGGVGIGVLALKNLPKITAIIGKLVELIKLKRFKQRVENKNTNSVVTVKVALDDKFGELRQPKGGIKEHEQENGKIIMNPKLKILKEGDQADQLEKGKRYLWGIDKDGKLRIAEETEVAPGKKYGHPSLFGEDGGRVGGEIKLNGETKKWRFSDESGRYSRGRTPEERNKILNNSKVLFKDVGLDIEAKLL